jgi:hypothetical protein
MPRREINIGTQGNDGTGDSIRESFRLTNENFRELYAAFGQGTFLSFLDLDDTPDDYLSQNNNIITVNSAGTGLSFKSINAGSGINLVNTANSITLSASLLADNTPRLAYHLNAQNQMIGNLRNPNQQSVEQFNLAYNTSFTERDFAITKGFGDDSYIGKSGGTMTGLLTLSGTPTSNLHAATKAYVDSAVAGIDNTDEIEEGTTNLFFTNTRARNAISQGTGVSYSSTTGVISIGQPVSTTSNVQFANITATGNLTLGGNFTVSGTTTTINTESLSVKDNMIYLNNGETATITSASGNGSVVTYIATNSFTAGNIVTITGITPSIYNLTQVTIASATGAEFTVNSTVTGTYVSGGLATAKVSVNPDIGISAGYYDTSYKHTGIFRDASDNGIWKFFDSYTPEPDDSVFINTEDASFRLAPIAVKSVSAETFTSTVSSGTAPFSVTSTTLVTNLNADLLDGESKTYYTNASNLSTGTIPSGILGNSTTFIGTTSIVLNRASANLALTGISQITFPGDTSGSISLKAIAVAGTNTITLPAITGTVVTTGDSGTVSGTMLNDGSVSNVKIASNAAIAVSKLSASTISGVTLGNNLLTLTLGTGLSGTSYNGSTAVTAALANTTVTAGSYGSSTAIPTFTVDAQGRLTAAGTASITTSFTLAGDNTTEETIGNGGTLTISGSTGITTNVAATGTITITNSGVTSAVAGTGVSVSSGTGAVTITNSGVTSAVAGTGVSVSSGTGNVTFSIGQSVSTTNDVRFKSIGVGIAATNISGEIKTTRTIAQLLSLTPGDEPAVSVDGDVAVADGTLWDPASNGSQQLMVKLGGVWKRVTVV